MSSRANDWKTAETAYGMAERFDPDNREAALNLAVSVEKQGRSDAAERLYLQCVNKAPSAAAWQDLGALYWSAGRWPDAARAFSEAVALDPKDPAPARFRDQALLRARRGSER